MPERSDIGDPAPAIPAPVAGGDYDDDGTVALSVLKGESSVAQSFCLKVAPANRANQLLTVPG